MLFVLYPLANGEQTMTDARDLDGELGYEPPSDLDESTEPAPLEDADQANRMMRRLRATEREATEVADLAAASIAQVTAWRDERLGVLGRTIAWCHRSLEGWMRATYERTGRQSVKLPAGTVALRKSPTRVEFPAIESAEAAAEWMTRGDELVTTKWSLAKREASKIVKPGPLLEQQPMEDYTAHQGMTEAGEALEGVIVFVPKVALGFSAKPAAAIEDLEAELADDDAVRLEPPA
jgi:hypothetical protein